MAEHLAYYPKYVPLTYPEKYERVNGLIRVLEDYTEKHGMATHNIICNKDSLFELVDRVDKRKVYFRVFYEKVKEGMSERNEAALYCFWILKLAPFFDATNPNSPINIDFAAYFLLKSIQYDCLKRGVRRTLPDKYIDDLKYAFRFRDISKESIMAIADTMAVK
ncbi:hypothetical protein R80B4_00311 [Fibrobacteres bacterium R8-0-B4]